MSNIIATKMTSAEVKDFFNGTADNLISASVSLGFHSLHSSNIEAFTGMNIMAIKMVEPSLRQFIPVIWDKTEKSWSLCKDKADKIRDLLKLERGQFTFAELVTAINNTVADKEEKKELAKAELIEEKANRTTAEINAEKVVELIKTKKTMKKYLDKRLEDDFNGDRRAMALALMGMIGTDNFTALEIAQAA
jgi:hypothetical protein